MATRALVSRGMLVLVVLVLAVAWLWMLGNSPVQGAATLTVTTTGDTNSCGTPCSLRGAIAVANSGDTIDIPAGTYTLSLGTELTIGKSLTLAGAGSGATIIQAAVSSADATFRVFNITNGNVVAISDVTIRHGKANGSAPANSGGGIYNSGTLTLTNSTVSGNSATSGGGAIFNNNAGTLTLTNSTVSGNTAFYGGGIYNNAGILILTNSTVSGNSATDFGGGIFSDGGTLTLTSSTLSGNTAGGAGGGIYNELGTLTLTNSTVSGNRAAYGGGISNQGTLALTNSTVSGNSATSSGGGIFNNNLGILTLTNSTVSGNSASSAGGISFWPGNTADLTNTIIAGNTNSDCSLSPNSHGHNLDGDGTCGLNATGDLSSTSPLLGPLQDNGGPTFTHALLSGSPAIDAGNDSVLGPPHNLTTDQRGIPRLQGIHVDIGAFEACGLPGNLVTVGWTLIGWACDAPGDPAAIATTLGGTVRIYGYDPTAPSNPWKIYDSAAPPFVNTLEALTKWNGYWVYYEQPVVVVGDVNGDGKADFIVGARGADPGGRADAGSAYVYSGADGSLLYQKDGGAASDRLGVSVSTAGDMNGDGKADFIVGAYYVDPGGRANAGSAYIYSGADGSLLYQRDGGAAGDNFGLSVSTAGDVNGDGKADFIVGALWADPGGRFDAGSAYVYSGADGSLLYLRDGGVADDRFGFSVSTAGDVNGDGNADFIVGAFAASPGGRVNAGSAYVYSGADGALLYQRDGGAAGDNFGISVSTAGDLNGDGKADFIVGAYLADPGGRLSAGSAYIYSGADGSILYQKDGEAAYDSFGYSVSGAK